MLTLLGLLVLAPTTLIRGGTLVDGSGSAPLLADIRIQGDRIAAIGKLDARPGETVIRARGLVIAPGFIDPHSHADGGIDKDPLALSQISQGITTAIVGQDGAWSAPVAQLLGRLEASRPSLNFAAFSGHGGIRLKVLGAEYKRLATSPEIASMAKLVDEDMRAGALGVSTGLEYDPGYYASTDELTEVAQAAARRGGLYISHVRDEADRAMEAFQEVADIARGAGLRGQISHIKLGSAKVWNRAQEVCDRFLSGASALTADVYPYVFWQSTMGALTPSREWDRREIWAKALADVGGAKNVRLTAYTHEPKWVGKTLAAISKDSSRDPISIIQEIMRRTHGPGGSGEESVAVTAMTERDLQSFMRHPGTMFCSDGQLGGTHPRGAGSFPRVLGRYVRELRVLKLEEAIRKMTSLPAQTLGLSKRGLLKPGFFADVVVFDPESISDRATAERPTARSVGVRNVFVNGVQVLQGGKATGRRPGRSLRRG